MAERKSNLPLECVFDLKSPREQLHSVKWYHLDHNGNMKEFYTYKPGSNPPAKTYKLPGIQVDVSEKMAIPPRLSTFYKRRKQNP